MNLSEKKIFITGASAGIGKAMVAELVNRGVTQLAVMGRREEPLIGLQNEFPDTSFLVIPGDIGKREDVLRASDVIMKTWGGLDILVNNAGVVSAGDFEKISDEDIIQMVQINLTGLMLLTKHLVPMLKKSKEGGIMNVSSGLGYIAQPFYGVYAATKAAVRQFSDALRREYIPYPLHVMTIFPTATDTPMMANAYMEKEMDKPEDVAKLSLDGMEQGLNEVVFGGPQRLADIKTNFENPEVIDERARTNREALWKRTENHRAM